MSPWKKYLWKLERPRGPLEHPEVLVRNGRPEMLVAPASANGGPSEAVLEWAARFPGWAPVNA